MDTLSVSVLKKSESKRKEKKWLQRKAGGCQENKGHLWRKKHTGKDIECLNPNMSTFVFNGDLIKQQQKSHGVRLAPS